MALRMKAIDFSLSFTGISSLKSCQGQKRGREPLRRGTHDAAVPPQRHRYVRPAIAQLNNSRSGNSTQVVLQRALARDGKANPVASIQTQHLILVPGPQLEGNLVTLPGGLLQFQRGGFAPLCRLILQANLVLYPRSSAVANGANVIVPGAKAHAPTQSGGWKILGLAFSHAAG